MLRRTARVGRCREPCGRVARPSPPSPLAPPSRQASLDGAYIALERLGAGELFQVLNGAARVLRASSSGPAVSRCGRPATAAHTAPRRRRDPGPEHGPHPPGRRDPFQAGGGSCGADEPAWGLAAAGEVLRCGRSGPASSLSWPAFNAFTGNATRPDPPARPGGAVHRRCGCVEDSELAVSVARRGRKSGKRKSEMCGEEGLEKWLG